MPTSASSRTSIQTGQARRYMTLVCKHWSHRFHVDFLPESATVDFGDSSCRFAVRDEALDIELTGTADALPELEAVVLEHLQRFSPQQTPLFASWVRHG
ncbi:DUF2218 domain-containing protein [Cupriavidus pauculus]